MKRIECEIEEVQLENDEGRMVPGLQATCTCCGAMTESFGTELPSARRCLALMREECPEGDDSYYYAEW